MLVAQYDSTLKGTLEGVLDGTIREICASRRERPGQDGLVPPVSQPLKPDDSEYIESLRGDDKRIFDIYE